MRYAAQLIDRAPRTRIVHVTIRRHLDLYGNPVSQDEIRACRQMLNDYLHEPSPKRSHLGHCSFLRRFSDLGYCLDAFVFLSDSYLKPAADIAQELTEWWEAFAPKSTGCVARVLPHAELAKETLERMTLVTEPDFYVHAARPSGASKKLRHFWCTRFPVKLRAAHRKGKAGSSGATAKQPGSADPLLEAAGGRSGKQRHPEGAALAPGTGERAGTTFREPQEGSSHARDEPEDSGAAARLAKRTL